MTTATIPNLITSLGLSLESSSPIGGVQGDWLHVSFFCRLIRNGKEIWSGPYKLGIGHVKIPKVDAWAYTSETKYLTNDERSHLFKIQKKPSVKFKGESLAIQASLYAKLAAFQKVAPTIPDIVHSLFSDGSAFFNRQTFEEWCSDFGYDTDSRKAEETFRACDLIGRRLSQAFAASEIETIQAALQDY